MPNRLDVDEQQYIVASAAYPVQGGVDMHPLTVKQCQSPHHLFAALLIQRFGC